MSLVAVGDGIIGHSNEGRRQDRLIDLQIRDGVAGVPPSLGSYALLTERGLLSYHSKVVHTSRHESALQGHTTTNHIDLSRLQQRGGLTTGDQGGSTVGPRNDTHTRCILRSRCPTHLNLTHAYAAQAPPPTPKFKERGKPGRPPHGCFTSPKTLVVSYDPCTSARMITEALI